MPLTNFFVRRPCVSIIVPYVILIIIAIIAFSAEMFNINFERDDSNLVNDDPIVIDNDIVTYAKDHLNREEAQIDKKRKEVLKDQVRYEAGGLNTILIIYENKSADLTGLITKKHIQNIIKLENEIIAWDKTSDNYKNKKFKNNANFKVKWRELCFAGEDAPIDPRTGQSECLTGNRSYVSFVGELMTYWRGML